MSESVQHATCAGERSDRAGREGDARADAAAGARGAGVRGDRPDRSRSAQGASGQLDMPRTPPTSTVPALMKVLAWLLPAVGKMTVPGSTFVRFCAAPVMPPLSVRAVVAFAPMEELVGERDRPRPAVVAGDVVECAVAAHAGGVERECMIGDGEAGGGRAGGIEFQGRARRHANVDPAGGDHARGGSGTVRSGGGDLELGVGKSACEDHGVGEAGLRSARTSLGRRRDFDARDRGDIPRADARKPFERLLAPRRRRPPSSEDWWTCC